MTTFTLFHLPYLAIKEVIKSLDPYELFALSIQSKRSGRIVKIALLKHKFKLSIALNQSDGNHLLQFVSENLNFLNIDIRPLAKKQTLPSVLSFPGNVVPAKFEFSDFTTRITSDWEDHNAAVHFMLRYISGIFSIDSIEVRYEGRDKKLANATNAVLKELNLKISCFDDHVNDYTFKQLESIISCTHGHIHMNYPRMKFEEFKQLYRKWFGGTVSFLVLKKAPGTMNLQPLVDMFAVKPELHFNNGICSFGVLRGDKSVSSVRCYEGTVVFDDYVFRK